MMPDEQPKKSEDLLRRYARAREAQRPASFPIPPGSRATWNQEIARLRPENSRIPQRPFWQGWWPRMVLLGGCTALVVVSLRLNPPESARAEKLADVAPRAPAEVSADKVETGVRFAGKEVRPSAAASAVNKPIPQDTLITTASSRARPFSNFKVEQKQLNVRLLDSDGSVYEGTLNQPVSLAAAPVAAVEAEQLRGRALRPARYPAAKATLATYQLEALGTNLETRERIVVNAQVQLPEGAVNQSNNYTFVSSTNTNVQPQTPLLRLEGAAQGLNQTQKLEAVALPK
jgi:hypothetical protein